MKQISSKIKIHTGGLSVINNVQTTMLNIVLWSFGALALSYVLVLGNMVYNITQRRVLEVRAQALSNEVSNLELSYLSLSNTVDLNLSYALGFKETHPKFATRKSLGYLPGAVKIPQNEI